MREEKLGGFWRAMWRTIVLYFRHNCPLMAAGMSFFGMLSLIPLTILGVSFLGYLLDSSEEAQQFVSKLLFENFPKSADDILNQINAIITSPRRSFINWLSLLGLIWSGMRFFNMLQRVLNDIWVGAIQRRFFRGRIAAFIGFILAGLLFWASFVFTSSMTAARELGIIFSGITLPDLRELWVVLEFAAQFAASFIMLFLVYLLVPNTRASMRAASIGGVFAAVFLQLARWGFSLIMIRFDVYGRVYGPLASVIMFMSWLYLSMTILLLGAELGSQCQEAFFNVKAKKAEEVE